MVKRLVNALSLTGNGFRDWLLQRISSVILALYCLFVLCYALFYSNLDFYAWQALFANNWMRVFSVLAMLSLLVHAWVGIWTVLTDYVKQPCLGLVLHILVVLSLFSYLAWAVAIVWGLR